MTEVKVLQPVLEINLDNERPIVRVNNITNTVTVSSVLVSGGSGGGSTGGVPGGWIYLTDVTGPVISNQVYQDAGNTVLQSFTTTESTFNLDIRASYPLVEVLDLTDTVLTSGTLPRDGDQSHYSGTVSFTVPSADSYKIRVTNPDGDASAEDTFTVALDLAPEILTLSFTGSYPGSQTELKENDTFQITGTTDKAIDQVQVQNFGACKFGTFVASGTSFTVTATIDDEGTTLQNLPARVQVRDAVTGALSTARDTNQGGGTTNGVDLVAVNNQAPVLSFGSITYPPTQQAIKTGEQATIGFSGTDLDTILFDSPTGELIVTNPTLNETTKTATYSSGTYNISTVNIRAQATRAANDSSATATSVIFIADAVPLITVSTPATRLRSGGNDGTAVQSYTITISSNQNLISVPTLAADSGGSRGSFSGGFSGGPTNYTASFQVADTDEKGAFSWESLVATNLANVVQNTIGTGTSYTLGGFVSRTVTWQAFQTVSDAVNVEISDFSKIQAGLFGATNQPSVRFPIGTATEQANGYTASATGTNPHTVTWLDFTAAGSNSGTADLFNYEEIV